MSAKPKQPKEAKQSNFSVWYNSPKGQSVVAAVYSIGAAIVILGALFKIQHWPGASIVLTAGMITEAVLFGIGVFEKPHKTYHWENIFPALTGNEEIAIGSLSGGGNGAGMTTTSLSDSDSKKLEESIKHLADTAGQLTNLSNAAASSEKLTKNLDQASESAAAFASKQQNLDAASNTLLQSYQDISSNLTVVSAGTKQYVEKSEALNNSLSAINTVYELQLKNVQAQADAINTQTMRVTAVSADLEKLHGSVSASAKDMDTYKQQTEKLAKQVSDLNTIYGNMLNAIHN